MPHISDHVTIAAPIETVFDTVADTRNEPRFNPSMTAVELLTPEPVGVGSQFRATMGDGRTTVTIELTGHDPPHRIESTSTSSLVDHQGAITFTESEAGTVMAWDWQIQAKGWLRVLGPLFGPVGARTERRIWTGLKTMLESGG